MCAQTPLPSVPSSGVEFEAACSFATCILCTTAAHASRRLPDLLSPKHTHTRTWQAAAGVGSPCYAHMPAQALALPLLTYLAPPAACVSAPWPVVSYSTHVVEGGCKVPALDGSYCVGCLHLDHGLRMGDSCALCLQHRDLDHGLRMGDSCALCLQHRDRGRPRGACAGWLCPRLGHGGAVCGSAAGA